jgi:hypothetical protein
MAPGSAQITATSEGKVAQADITVRDGGVITPAGGTLSAANGAVTLSAPSGALAQTTHVSVEASTSAPADPRLVAGAAFDLGPNGIAFAQPVTLTLRYPPSGISNGSPESALRLYRVVGTAWQEVPGSSVDIAAKTVVAPIAGFSTFAVLGRHAVDRVTISAPSTPVSVGGTLQLTATVVDAGGNTVTDRPVTWASLNETIASVNATGLVRGESVGSATITATAEGKSGSIQVAVPPPGILLAVGESRTLSAAQAGSIAISGELAGAEFMLMPFHNSLTPAATVALEFSSTNVTTVAGPPRPSLGPAVPSRLSIAAASDILLGNRSESLDGELRRLERTFLTRYIASARRTRTSRGSAALAGTGSLAAVPAVGDAVTYNTARGCTTPDLRAGTVKAVTTRSIIVADNNNPAGGFTDAEYADIARRFDSFVYPVAVTNFGAPVDIDDNGGRTIVFYTRAVNELTPQGSTAVTAGFFQSRDLFPAASCGTSNYAEMFYMLVPDETGVVNGNVRSKASVLQGTIRTVGHEFQHLINASRRIYVNDALDFEEVWLNEGLSHIAEELLFYASSGLAPKQNITLATLQSSQAAVEAVNSYQLQNLVRLIDYLGNPEANSPFAANDELATRGSTWQLLRYAADRSTMPHQTLWFSLVNSRSSGITNFTGVFGGDFGATVRDWATAQYADDAVPSTPAVHQHPSWHFRSVLPALLAGTNPPYPLRTRTLAVGAPTSLTLQGGSAAYLRFAVPGGTTAALTSTSSGSALPAAVSVTLVRTK